MGVIVVVVVARVLLREDKVVGDKVVEKLSKSKAAPGDGSSGKASVFATETCALLALDCWTVWTKD
jgi:hypothetical protein